MILADYSSRWRPDAERMASQAVVAEDFDFLSAQKNITDSMMERLTMFSVVDPAALRRDCSLEAAKILAAAMDSRGD